MAAAHQLILLDAISQELGPAQWQSGLRKQLGQAGLAFISLMSHPCKDSLEYLHQVRAAMVRDVHVFLISCRFKKKVFFLRKHKNTKI